MKDLEKIREEMVNHLRNSKGELSIDQEIWGIEKTHYKGEVYTLKMHLHIRESDGFPYEYFAHMQPLLDFLAGVIYEADPEIPRKNKLQWQYIKYEAPTYKYSDIPPYNFLEASIYII